MKAKVKKWGNSYAIRLTKKDLEELGLEKGDEVKVEIKKINRENIDLSGLPTFHDEDEKASEHHDRHLYGRDKSEDR